MFTCETIIFYVPLGSIYILVFYVSGNIENKSLFITFVLVTIVNGVDNHQLIQPKI